MCYVCMYVCVCDFTLLCSSLQSCLHWLTYVVCVCVLFVMSFIPTTTSSSSISFFLCSFSTLLFFFLQPFCCQFFSFFSPFYFKTISLCAFFSDSTKLPLLHFYFPSKFLIWCWFVNFHTAHKVSDGRSDDEKCAQ